MPDTQQHEIAFPLIVGVTGHRNIRPQDVAELEARVEQILLAIRAEWVGEAADENPGSLTLLTGLASGADELVARVATRPHIGAKIVAGLPMPRDLYERDFESPAQLEAFHEMLAKAQVFELPMLEGSSAAAVAAGGEARDRQYEALAVHIARQSYILLALWDGKHTDRVGGTSQTVHLKLHQCVNRYHADDDLLGVPTVGPVYQIVTPRQGMAVPGDALSVKVPLPDGTFRLCKGELSLKTLDPATLQGIRRLRKFNIEIGSTEGASETVDQERLIPKELVPEALEPLRIRHERTDRLSHHYQARWYDAHRKYFWYFMALGVLMNAFYYLSPLRGVGPELAKVHAGRWILIVAYTATIAILQSIYRRANREELHRKFHEYRGLAEGLRVQLFWRLAGVKAGVADFYLRYQEGELEWLRVALKASEGTPSILPAAAPSVIGQYWIKSQSRFFAERAKSAAARDARKRRQIAGALAVAVIWGAAKVLADPIDGFLGGKFGLATCWVVDWVFVAAAMSSIIAAGLAGWRQVECLAENARRYAKMVPVYQLATSRLEVMVPNTPDYLVRARRLMEELGREALTENGDWVVLQSQQKLEQPK